MSSPGDKIRALVLGGHSFISQLGNQPQPDAATRALLVATCIARGLTWFDTTYEPERELLGIALRDTGLVDQAKVVVWNFFGGFGPANRPYGPSPWRSEHLALVQRNLGRQRIDALVVHLVGDAEEDARQEALARRWLDQGLVGCLGLWNPSRERLAAGPGVYAFQVQPCNVGIANIGQRLADAQAAGWITWGTSPFNRGWLLDAAVQRQNDEAQRVVIAGQMLRWALYAPGVARLVVAMREVRWVHSNLAAAAAGPLNDSERTTLEQTCAPPPRP